MLYHGFAASGLQGTPQGLAVYVNGVRFNQPFGDTVDWDLIPDIAIDRINLEGSNPVFGLNALGGSVNVQLKNGFTYQGFEASLSGGSFGQIQGEFQYGRQVGNASTYVAGTRPAPERLARSAIDGPAEHVRRYRLAQRARRAAPQHHRRRIPCSTVQAPRRSNCWRSRRARSSPRRTRITNTYDAVSLNGSVDISDTTSVQAVAYYRYFLQRVTNGNAPNDTPCNDGSGLLCSDAGFSTTLGGAFIPDFLNGGPYSELDNQTTNTNAYGVSAQITNPNELFGLKNHIVAGVSFDGAQTAVRRDLVHRRPDDARPRVHRPRRGDRRAGHQLAGPRRDLQRHLWRVRRRHTEPHAAACRDTVGPVQRGPDRSE